MNDLFQRGFYDVGSWRGIRFRVHWSFVVALLLFGGFRFAPGFWLGFTLLLLVHELGHAALVRLYGYSVLDIDLTGLGGLCRWSGLPTPAQRSVIAWGGVIAQLVVFVPAFVVSWFLSRSWFLGDLLYALTWSNLLLVGLNLLPFPGFDGYEAWRLFRMSGWRRSVFPGRSRRKSSRAKHSSHPDISWFPRGVGAKGQAGGRSRGKGSHLRDVSYKPDAHAEKVAQDLMRIAEEARKAKDHLN